MVKENLNISKWLIDKKSTVKQAMKQMRHVGEKLLFVVSNNSVLYGALSDGDIRKWILKKNDLSEKITKICNKQPIILEKSYNVNQVKKIFIDLKIQALPIVSRNKIIDVISWDDIFAGEKDVKVSVKKVNIPLVVMAGGKGTRLDPFTRVLPKPLIPIGDKPIVEHIVENFSEYGVKEFYFSVNHKAKMIRAYFDEMKDIFNIKYLEESKPLGTAGGLRPLFGERHKRYFVVNCDIFLGTNISDIVDFHDENNNDVTVVASYKHHVMPYGVCNINKGGELKSIDEKPEYDFLINIGAYILNKRAIKLIPANKMFHMTDLIKACKKEKFKIKVFPISDNMWMDIGQLEEYRRTLKTIGMLQD
ncbi:MAG: sugar phosphate nucleotidyltransferase [Candidatus Omnitrophica bacterium]|nr:sugar phosphate nucleotidyltransferase [Candidatus Omnitrophota bacterium]